MIIVDNKPAPPPYTNRSNTLNSAALPPPFYPHARARVTLLDLPQHVLLQVIYSTFPNDPRNLEGARATLRWLVENLRRVSRGVYIACMHVLRSTYLPLYAQAIKPPYTSDPFPHSAPSPLPESGSPLVSAQRETSVLDHFIVLRAKRDALFDESELHLDLDSFKDIFEWLQPRSRCEDLVREIGVRAGLITLSPTSTSRAVSFSVISVNWSSRKVGLAIIDRAGRKKTIVNVERARDESLEMTARALVSGLKKIMPKR